MSVFSPFLVCCLCQVSAHNRYCRPLTVLRIVPLVFSETVIIIPLSLPIYTAKETGAEKLMTSGHIAWEVEQPKLWDSRTHGLSPYLILLPTPSPPRFPSLRIYFPHLIISCLLSVAVSPSLYSLSVICGNLTIYSKRLLHQTLF